MGPAAGSRQLLPFAALSATYFSHVGFFNPYLPLWLQSLGLPIVVISLLTALQSFTRVFAPYAWGALSDHTGQRVKLLRYAASAALVLSFGLWLDWGPWWLGLVLLVLFTHTSSMMSLTEAAVAQLVAGDWGRYGRVRLWGSVGFLVTVFAAGAWFERFGMGHFTAWTVATLGLVVACTFWIPDLREPVAHESEAAAPIGPVLRQPAVRWFFGSLFFHQVSHYAIYGFLSLYLDSLGYGKAMIGALWAVSVVVEIAWFFRQGRLIGRFEPPRWLALCGAVMVLRMAATAGLGQSVLVLFLAQATHALTFAAHHTSSIALVSHHFPGRLRTRGQALFTITGYGLGGVFGVLAGGALASRWGIAAVFIASTGAALLGTLCALRAERMGLGGSPAGGAPG